VGAIFNRDSFAWRIAIENRSHKRIHMRHRLAAKPWYPWYALGVLTLVYTSSHVDRQIMGILLEPIKQELGASDTQMGFLVGLTFAIFYATLGMPIAMLADRTNRRNIVTAAVTIWSGMTALCGYAATFFQLALARIGVGIGEAGSSPPSHSIISDLFPIETRGTAMGLFALGVNFGLLVAYLGGGFLSEYVGWRMTFVVIGVPGLAIALLLHFTTIEPRRGAMELSGGSDFQSRSAAPTDSKNRDWKSLPQVNAPKRPLQTETAPSFFAVWRHLWSNLATRHLTIGAALAGFTGYGFTLWMPTFFMRSHDLDPSEVGLVLALMTGVVGGLGTFTAGRLTDVLARRDERWRAWLVALAKGGYVPFLVGFFFIEELGWALALYVIPAFFGGFYMAPTFTLVQNLVDIRMRALASSIVLFILNIIGMGFGPQLVGILSDAFAPSYGHESLRMALMVLGLLNFWCAYHYFRAGNALPRGESLKRAG
jgi:MFS family permease